MLAVGQCVVVGPAPRGRMSPDPTGVGQQRGWDARSGERAAPAKIHSFGGVGCAAQWPQVTASRERAQVGLVLSIARRKVGGVPVPQVSKLMGYLTFTLTYRLTYLYLSHTSTLGADALRPNAPSFARAVMERRARE